MRVHPLRTNNGVSLVEVLVSVFLIGILIMAATETIIDSQFFNSYSRHKVQTMYAAQQLLEAQRQQPFAAASFQTPVQQVILDTSGSTNPAKYFYGSAVTTLTHLSADLNQVSVQISWSEKTRRGPVTMTENYLTVIANDPIPN
jgi:prepilin-type N-terminal cleavage/methylation domain-containing protein